MGYLFTKQSEFELKCSVGFFKDGGVIKQTLTVAIAMDDYGDTYCMEQEDGVTLIEVTIDEDTGRELAVIS